MFPQRPAAPLQTDVTAVAVGDDLSRGPLPGAYVHVPFCLRRCDYCDFATFAGLDDIMPRYVDAVVAHVRAAAGTDAWPELGSVHLGGGTPTYLPPPLLGRVLGTLRAELPLARDAEVTVEANPETVTAEMAETLSAGGVNRVSLGAQSFAPHVLDVLGRWHDPEATLRAVATLRAAGIARLSLDLIYGTPGESDGDWERSLRTALEAGVDHVSAYALTVEANTPYATRAGADPRLQPDPDVQADRMAIAAEVLPAAGLQRYEISNWARPGEESRHNLLYWRGEDWLAFGAAAHGHRRGHRWWNHRHPAAYADAVLQGASPIAGEEHLDAEAIRTERLLMGLRLVEGVPRHAVEPLDPAAVRRLADLGLLTDDGSRLALTTRGMALGGAVTLELAAALQPDATLAISQPAASAASSGVRPR